jgi:hypothetical protein
MWVCQRRIFAKNNNPLKHNNQNKLIAPPPEPLPEFVAGADEATDAVLLTRLELDATLIELAIELLAAELDETVLEFALELELLAGSSAGGVPV